MLCHGKCYIGPFPHSVSDLILQRHWRMSLVRMKGGFAFFLTTHYIDEAVE